MIIESPLPHEADAVGNDAINDQFGVVTHSEVLSQQRVVLPDFVDEGLLAVVEGVSHPGNAELVVFRSEIA